MERQIITERLLIRGEKWVRVKEIKGFLTEDELYIQYRDTRPYCVFSRFGGKGRGELYISNEEGKWHSIIEQQSYLCSNWEYLIYEVRRCIQNYTALVSKVNEENKDWEKEVIYRF